MARKPKVAKRKAPNYKLRRALLEAPNIVERRLQNVANLLNLTGGNLEKFKDEI